MAVSIKAFSQKKESFISVGKTRHRIDDQHHELIRAVKSIHMRYSPDAVILFETSRIGCIVLLFLLGPSLINVDIRALLTAVKERA